MSMTDTRKAASGGNATLRRCFDGTCRGHAFRLHSAQSKGSGMLSLANMPQPANLGPSAALLRREDERMKPRGFICRHRPCGCGSASLADGGRSLPRIHNRDDGDLLRAPASAARTRAVVRSRRRAAAPQCPARHRAAARRYFPELVEILGTLEARQFVVDGNRYRALWSIFFRRAADAAPPG